MVVTPAEVRAKRGNPRRAGGSRLALVGRFSTAIALLCVATAARPAAAVSVNIADLYGTGNATQTSLVANGAEDPHYRVTEYVQLPNISGTQAPYGAFPPLDPSIFTGTPRAYNIESWTSVHPNVASTSNGFSRWIAPPSAFTSTDTSFSPANQLVIAPVGHYTYETTFTLPSSLVGITRIFISGSYFGDNETPSIRLNPSGTNANLIETFSGAGPFSYETKDPLNSFFQSGTNRLLFKVINQQQSPTDFYNPTGIQVIITGGFYEVPEIDPAGLCTVFSLVFGSLGAAEGRLRRRRLRPGLEPVPHHQNGDGRLSKQ
jgi:hypothetical protein